MKARIAVGCAAVALTLAGGASGQCTPGPHHFCVTEGPKSASHPNQGGWCCNAWYIDDVEAKELTLYRGETYTFKLNNVDFFHPFYLSTSELGGGLNRYTTGVTPAGSVTGNATLTFVVGATAPNLLYYQCSSHQRMGWKIHIEDPPPCFADYNGDGFVDGIDYDMFNNDFEAGNPEADVNGDGFVDGIDSDEFNNHFETGC